MSASPSIYALFVEWVEFLDTDSISETGIELFRFSISSIISFFWVEEG
jgi:hypothetical protein